MGQEDKQKWIGLGLGSSVGAGLGALSGVWAVEKRKTFIKRNYQIAKDETNLAAKRIISELESRKGRALLKMYGQIGKLPEDKLIKLFDRYPEFAALPLNKKRNIVFLMKANVSELINKIMADPVPFDSTVIDGSYEFKKRFLDDYEKKLQKTFQRRIEAIENAAKNRLASINAAETQALKNFEQRALRYGLKEGLKSGLPKATLLGALGYWLGSHIDKPKK